MATSTTNENITNLAVGDVFNAGDYEVTVTFLEKGSQALGWTGTGLVTQNLIAGVKIPMSVVFEKIKINSCYQYYNKGENGAVVRSKVDESWGSVVSLDEVLTTIRKHYIDLQDVLSIYSGNELDKKKLNEIAINLSKYINNQDLSNGLTKSIIDDVHVINCLISQNKNSRVSSSCNAIELLNKVSNTLNSSELVTFDLLNLNPLDIEGNEFTFLGESPEIKLGSLPSGVCIEYVNDQNYAFCTNDKPNVNKAKQLGLLDEIGKENILNLLQMSENYLWSVFKLPFIMYGLDELYNNFLTGKSKIISLNNNSNFMNSLKSSPNFNIFQKEIIRLAFEKIKSGKINDLNSSYFNSMKLLPPNLSERDLSGNGLPTATYVAMGGTQKVEFKVKVFKKNSPTGIPVDNFDIRNYAFKLEVTIWDTFGMDWDDVNSGKKGESILFEPLRAGFILQHYYKGNPFFVSANFIRSIQFIKK